MRSPAATAAAVVLLCLGACSAVAMVSAEEPCAGAAAGAGAGAAACRRSGCAGPTGDTPQPQVQAQAPAQAEPCKGLPDGFHGHPASPDCRDYMYCAGGRGVGGARCGSGRVWNGSACASTSSPEGWRCVGPAAPWPPCAALPAGRLLQAGRAGAGGGGGASSGCQRRRLYLHCAHGNRTLLACPPGRTFSTRAQACLPLHTSAEEEEEQEEEGDACRGAVDGYRAEPGSACRSYSFCAAGHKITYVCPPGLAFDGAACAPAAAVPCAQGGADAGACQGLRDGYHGDAASRCRRYFFCLAGARLIALSCPPGRAFDGRRCAPGDACPAAPAPAAPADAPAVANALVAAAAAPAPARRTQPSDPAGDMVVDAPAAECANASNGFYQDLQAGCRRYFFCIEGRKTTLVCPPDHIFDGELCVDARTYTCPLQTTNY